MIKAMDNMNVLMIYVYEHNRSGGDGQIEGTIVGLMPVGMALILYDLRMYFVQAIVQ
jgi:hypothetical protein